jgi:protein-tyrosine-phosphatase
LKKILFVCSGNTCRSPLAEGIARRVLSDRIKIPIEFSSAGCSAFEGMPATQHAASVAAQHGVDLSKHRSRLLNRQSVKDADLIVTMADKHRKTVGVIDPDALSYTVKITEFCNEFGDVPDPIGGDRTEYERVYDLIERCIEAMAERLDDYEGWKSEKRTNGNSARKTP